MEVYVILLTVCYPHVCLVSILDEYKMKNMFVCSYKIGQIFAENNWSR